MRTAMPAGAGVKGLPRRTDRRKRNPRGTEQISVPATREQRNTGYNVATTIYTHLTGHSSTGERIFALRAGGGLAGRSFWRVVRLGPHSRQLAETVRAACSEQSVTGPHSAPCDRPAPPAPGSPGRLAEYDGQGERRGSNELQDFVFTSCAPTDHARENAPGKTLVQGK